MNGPDFRLSVGGGDDSRKGGGCTKVDQPPMHAKILYRHRAEDPCMFTCGERAYGETRNLRNMLYRLMRDLLYEETLNCFFIYCMLGPSRLRAAYYIRP